MQTLEFKSKIIDNKILIPRKMQSELITGNDKMVRVVVFMEDAEVNDEKAYQQMTTNQFLKGYSDSDAVYDL